MAANSFHQKVVTGWTRTLHRQWQSMGRGQQRLQTKWWTRTESNRETVWESLTGIWTLSCPLRRTSTFLTRTLRAGEDTISLTFYFWEFWTILQIMITKQPRYRDIHQTVKHKKLTRNFSNPPPRHLPFGALYFNHLAEQPKISCSTTLQEPANTMASWKTYLLGDRNSNKLNQQSLPYIFTTYHRKNKKLFYCTE